MLLKFWKIPGLNFSVWNFRVIVAMVSYLSHRWYVLIKTYLDVCDSTILCIFNQTLPESTRISLRILGLESIHWAVFHERKVEAHTLRDAWMVQLLMLIFCVDFFESDCHEHWGTLKVFPKPSEHSDCCMFLDFCSLSVSQVFYSRRVLCSMIIWSHPAHLYLFSLGKNVINNVLSCVVDPKP
jgi:hypothetical protein